jgi:hypothetical protein
VEARRTSRTASLIVMKKRSTSGCVTVIGPPRRSCSVKSGMTEPDEPRTLPKRTVRSRVGRPRLAAAAVVDSPGEFARALRRAQDRHGIDGLVGRDEHGALDAGRDRRLGDFVGPERVGAGRRHRMRLDEVDVLERGRVKDKVGLEAAEGAPEIVRIRHAPDDRPDRQAWVERFEFPARRRQSEFGLIEEQDFPRRRARPPGGRARNRSSRRRR